MEKPMAENGLQVRVHAIRRTLRLALLVCGMGGAVALLVSPKSRRRASPQTGLSN